MEAFFMKENDKVLISKLLLKATFVLLVISVFLKLCGLNVFGADTSNAVLISISNFIDKYYLKYPLDWLLLFIQYFLFFKLSCNNCDNVRYIICSLTCTVLTSFIQFLLYGIYINLNDFIVNIIYSTFTIILLIVFSLINDFKIIQKEKQVKKYLFKCIKSSAILIIIITVYQYIALFLRNITITQTVENVYDLLLNFDYTILLLVTYYLKIKANTHIE